MISNSGHTKTYPIELFMRSGADQENATSLTMDDLNGLKTGDRTRVDGRKLDGHRPICIKAGTSASADGSAYAELGNTKLYCVATGPHEISRGDSTSDASWRALLNVKVTYAPFALPWKLKKERSEQDTIEERSYAAALAEAFAAVVILEKYPRSQIDVLVTVIEDDGGVLPLAMMACSVALSNAGIETYDVVVAASLLMMEGHFFVDPTLDELLLPVAQSDGDVDTISAERAQITYSLMPSLNQVICLNQDGQLTAKNVSQAMKLSSEVCYHLYPVIQKAILKSVKPEKEPRK